MSAAITVLATAAAALPFALLAALSAGALSGRPLPERWTGPLVRFGFGLAFLSLLAAAALQLSLGEPVRSVPLGAWFATPGYRFEVGLRLDLLSLVFALFALALAFVVAAFSHRYLHREPGYQRFFLTLTAFAGGLLLIALGGSIELTFAGWELVGVSSALLVAFFHERPGPVANGLRVYVVYHACDLGLLGASVLLHHAYGTGDYAAVLGAQGGPAALAPAQANAVALLLLLAAMGKCGMLPFSGWLPRAMEGPTPSSAIFYGALSVHAGAFLLLRLAPLLDRAPVAAGLTVGLGLITSLHATFVGRAQTDIKTALAYASLTQVGLVWVEIGLGLDRLALAHIVGHGCLRSLQFLRAPSLLHDFHRAENAVGGHLARTGAHLERWLPPAAQRWLYRLALERAQLDVMLEEWILGPLLAGLRRLDALERRWAARFDSAPRPRHGAPPAPERGAP